MITIPDIPTGMSTAEVLELARLAKAGVVLEMGSWFGYSTYVLSQVVDKLHAVDWHKGAQDVEGLVDTLPAYISTLRSMINQDRVISHIGRFEDVLPLFRSNYFDGCFVDGAHDDPAVRRDISLMDRLVKPGGWVAFHDYGRPGKGFEVNPGVNDYANKYNSPIQITDTLAVVHK